jgi:hypothetical protein
MAAPENPASLPPEIAEQMEAVGVAPTLGNLQDIIAKWHANAAKIAEHERVAKAREVLWPLGALVPLHVDGETARVAAARGELVAFQTKKGAHWFASVNAVEDWLRRGHWFPTAEAEARWRETIRFRTSQDQGMRQPARMGASCIRPTRE